MGGNIDGLAQEDDLFIEPGPLDPARAHSPAHLPAYPSELVQASRPALPTLTRGACVLFYLACFLIYWALAVTLGPLISGWRSIFMGILKFPLRPQLSTDQLPPLNAANTPGRDKRIGGATTYEVASALASLCAVSGSLSARPASLLPSCAHAETYEDQNPVREMAPDPHEDDGTV